MTTVLIVDDDKNSRRISVLLLEDYGYDTISAEDLGKGLYAAKTNAFDVLVAHKNLGDYHGVVPLLEFMHDDRTGVPVIVCSGEDMVQARRELYGHAFLEKGKTALVPEMFNLCMKYNIPLSDKTVRLTKRDYPEVG